MRVVFEEIAARWSRVTSAGPPERLRSNFISGVKSLPVRVTWR
jgi:cholest-4-en-3-one 26-monooxygenase